MTLRQNPHGSEWWNANAAKAAADLERGEQLVAYQDSCRAAYAWAMAQLQRGQPIALVVPTLRIKYQRAWRRLVRSET